MLRREEGGGRGGGRGVKKGRDWDKFTKYQRLMEGTRLRLLSYTWN